MPSFSLSLSLAGLLCFAGFGSSETPARLALYVGIDQYPHLDGGNLEGCVNDVVHLERLFSDQFGFETVQRLVNEQATRAGIGAAMLQMADAVARARGDDGRPVSVLVVYAGHGLQVADQASAPGRDEEDGLDETWMPYDSDWSGRNDIRDDDIDTFLGRLSDLGAEVLILSDSCHSGTVHRGAAWARTRSPRPPKHAERARPGPTSSVFSGSTESHHFYPLGRSLRDSASAAGV